MSGRRNESVADIASRATARDYARSAGGRSVDNLNFGPVPGDSTLLWQTKSFIIYRDKQGKVWRYHKEFRATWPFEIG